MKNACKKCPWRKSSLAGWLGAASPEEFTNMVKNGARLPCHCQVDYESDDWQEQCEKVSPCVGSIIAMRKRCKMPYDQEMVEIYLDVNSNDPEMMSCEEFEEHHNGAIAKSW